ncbi:MAG: HAMP domain-containing histidine kinase [Spirochaetales bacterium]|jgi:two-component system sensor histidine kinase HydH|nr:HAMP domain-containing histidine kinase [Spirochaetales bacterium]
MKPFECNGGKEPPRGQRGRFVSFLAAFGVFLVMSVLGLAILRGQLYVNRLFAHNDAEKTLNRLFSVMRDEWVSRGRSPHMGRMHRQGGPDMDFSEFAETLDLYPMLKKRIRGIGAYTRAGKTVFSYGDVPESFALPENEEDDEEGFSPRNYVFDRESRSLLIVNELSVRRRGNNAEDRASVFLFAVREERYWFKNALAWGIFSGWEVLLLAGIFLIRGILAKNSDYRRRLQEQRSLVALGTAARTLAHEIKNPLSAIQLQADIIGRLCPGKVSGETTAITQEVSRLQSLAGRVGDFLREPRGSPRCIDRADFNGSLVRRCAVDIRFSSSGEPRGFADPDRLRSVVENLLRNALESGGAEPITARVGMREGRAFLEVLDRGRGLPPGDREQLFDPFFTTKNTGSGVGLSLARRFTEAAGGRLVLEDREGGGVRAEISFPRAEEEEAK